MSTNTLHARRIALIALCWSCCVCAHAAQLADYRAGFEPTPTTYKTIGATALHLWRFPAAGAAASTRQPALLLIHGGGWTGGKPSILFPQARYFAERGLVAISINYRLLTSQTPGGPTLADCVADCSSAMRFIRSHAAELGIDPARIAVLGESAGGHLAGALGTLDQHHDPSDDLTVSAKPNAMILCNPIVDMLDTYWVRYAIGDTALRSGAPPEALIPDDVERAYALTLSPLANVRPGQPPTLVMHGLADTIVHPDHARHFAAAMLAAGNRCDLVLVDGAEHAFILDGYTAPEPVVVEATRTIDRFLASLGYLHGEPTLQAAQAPPNP